MLKFAMWVTRRVIRRLFLALVAFSVLTFALYAVHFHTPPAVVMDYLDVPLIGDAEMGHERHFRFLHTPDHARCSRDVPTLVVYVHSAPVNSERRRLIRNTWGHRRMLVRVEATLMFVMGMPRSVLFRPAIEIEVRQHGDILMADFVDSYRNLTLKAVAALQWVTQNCSRARYILKTDDDILVDILQLTSLLTGFVDNLTRGRDVLLCNHYTGNYTRVERQSDSKWRVSLEEFSGRNYPDFCQGAAFVMSADVARALHQQSLRSDYFRLDDVFITGFVRDRIGLEIMPYNKAYFTGTQTLLQLAQNRTVKPMFFEEHDRKTYFKIWKYVKKGECCPPIVDRGQLRPFAHIESMYT